MNQQNKSFQLNGENVYAGRLKFRYCQRFINIGPPNALSSSLLQYISATHVDELICYMTIKLNIFWQLVAVREVKY